MFNFINKIMSKLHLTIFQATLPIISQELKDLLQVSPNTKTRDWYIFKNDILIKIYGFEGQTYLLPAFLTPRVYALEFIRQRLASNELDFVSNNKASTFRLHQKIGPFVVKSRTTRKLVEEVLQDMNFQQGEKIKYDPHNIISKKRTQGKIYAYENQFITMLHRVADQYDWEQVKNILVDVGQNVEKKMFSSSIAIGTPLKGDKEIHRPKVESSTMEIDGIRVSKRPKLSQDK